MRLTSVAAHPSNSRGACNISDPHYTDSDYRFVLNAVKGNPRGSHLTLTFAK